MSTDDRELFIPATPTGPQIGASEVGLGDAIRSFWIIRDNGGAIGRLHALADRADALERTLDGALAIAEAYRADHLTIERVRTLASDLDQHGIAQQPFVAAAKIRTALDGPR
jgi:N-acetylglutamate synthase-like GNAT family acetyltransferase